MNRNSFMKGTFSRLLALVMALSLLTGCGAAPVETTPSTVATEPTAVATEPPATIPADGEPGSITAQGSYTAEDAEAEAAADDVIAVISVTRTETVEATESGTEETTAPAETDAPTETTEPAETEVPTETTVPTEIEATAETTIPEETDAPSETSAPEETEAPAETEVDTTIPVETTSSDDSQPDQTVVETVTVTEEIPLTNRQLQAFYWLEVASYRQAYHEIAPDFSKPLDTQICSIDDTVGSWQQYFLREALHTWAVSRALTLQSQFVPLGFEEAFLPNAEKHAEYFVDVPVLDTVYYGNRTHYQPNRLHQAHLDNLPNLLSQLAEFYGYADSEELAQATAGVSAEDLIAAAELYNRGYMYFTELTYHITPTTEEVEAYYLEHEAEYVAAGITRDSGKYVDMRHILTLPKNATVADDGTVTAEEYDWTQSYWAAQNKLSKIRETYPRGESVFANYAANESLDAGSAMNGGLYENLLPGQMPEELDVWLFDSAREAGDTALIQSPCGMHIVYYCGDTEIWYETAKNDLSAYLYRQFAESLLEQYPADINYDAIRIGQAEDPLLACDDLLYSDIAHERYTEAPLYLQQDYPNTRYGAYSIVTHGCGITTMAMLATYMTDTELTPPELCERYGRYCSVKGTDRTLYVHTPPEMGFYLKEQVFNSKLALQALEEGYIVVCLQHEGFWTRGGHFLLLEKMNENGTIQVRDSNIYNYSKLDGHKIDEFEWNTIPPAAVSFWIFYPKQTTHNQCVRCADAELAPDVMFNTEYLCGKCSAALLRRDTYLNN